MFSVFTRIIRDKRNAFLAYSIGAILTIEMYIALFPAIRDQAQQLNKLLEAYPKGLMEAFGFNGTEALFSRLESFMSTEYFSFFWPIMVITMLVAFANLMIVAEIEKGTIELTLAQPISRLKLFVSRYLAGVVYFVCFGVLSIFAIIPLARLHNISYQLDHYYTMLGISLLFGLAVFSIAVFFSAIFSEKGRATAFTAATLMGMYVANIAASLETSLENLRYFSLFYYFNPNQVFGSNVIVEYSVPVFVGITIVFTLAAAYWFNRRDVAV